MFEIYLTTEFVFSLTIHFAPVLSIVCAVFDREMPWRETDVESLPPEMGKKGFGRQIRFLYQKAFAPTQEMFCHMHTSPSPRAATSLDGKDELKHFLLTLTPFN